MKHWSIFTFLSGRVGRLFAILLISAIVAGNLLCYYFYGLADTVVSSYAPDKIPNRNITEFYFAPIVLRPGSRIDKATLTDHLREIAYQDGGTGSGGFVVDDNSVSVYSRFPDIFPSAVIRFDRDRVSSIEVDRQNMDELVVEPLQMNTNVHLLNSGAATRLTKEQRTRRIVVRPENIPQVLKDIITASEDYKFFENQGIDWIAMPKRLVSGTGGGSGIVFQIAKNNFYYGASEGAFWKVGLPEKLERKLIAEPFVALSLNERFSKDELFAAYVNMIPFSSSNGVELQGIVSAAQEFFGKSQLSDLTLAETASLAAMINYPSGYLNYVRNGNRCPEVADESPSTFARLKKKVERIMGRGDEERNRPNSPPCKDLTKKRNIVLDLVYRNHANRYSREEIDAAKATPLSFVFASEQNETRQADAYSGLFSRFAFGKLPDDLNRLRSEEGNVKVITSLDPQLQRAAFEIAEESIRIWQPKIDQATRRQKSRSPEKYARAIGECEKANGGPAGQNAIERCDPSKLLKAQVALVAMDAQTGEILSMVGGIGTQFNFATMAKRSSASTIKPFVYMESIRSGRTADGEPVTAATFIDKTVENELLRGVCVDDESNLGGNGTLRRQLQMSSNIGACFAAQSAGIPNEIVGKLIGSEPPKSLQFAIGVGGETSLLNLVQAYSIFPNNGKFVTATAFKRAYQESRRIDFAKPESSQEANPPAAFIVTDMMRSVIEHGTASGFRKLAKLPDRVAFAGKTGTGMEADLLFIGFTPRLVVGVWLGMENNFPELRMSDGFQGGKVAAPIAAKFMQAVAKYRPELLKGEFVQPEDVIQMPINEKGCPVAKGGKNEYFIAGREPKPCE